MEKLGITKSEIAEFDRELAEKLAGKAKVEDSSDQLMQEALKL